MNAYTLPDDLNDTQALNLRHPLGTVGQVAPKRRFLFTPPCLPTCAGWPVGLMLPCTRLKCSSDPRTAPKVAS
jgi:hypothetical protein